MSPAAKKKAKKVAQKTQPAKKRGRPRKPPAPRVTLTQEIIDDVVAVLRNGAYIETAAAIAGISKQSLYLWARQGTRDKRLGQATLNAAFADAIKSAQAQAEMDSLAAITKAAESGEWTAAAWRLERKFPTRWGRFVPRELPQQRTRSVDDEAQALAKAYLAIRRADNGETPTDNASDDDDDMFDDLDY